MEYYPHEIFKRFYDEYHQITVHMHLVIEERNDRMMKRKMKEAIIFSLVFNPCFLNLLNHSCNEKITAFDFLLKCFQDEKSSFF